MSSLTKSWLTPSRCVEHFKQLWIVCEVSCCGLTAGMALLSLSPSIKNGSRVTNGIEKEHSFDFFTFHFNSIQNPWKRPFLLTRLSTQMSPLWDSEQWTNTFAEGAVGITILQDHTRWSEAGEAVIVWQREVYSTTNLQIVTVVLRRFQCFPFTLMIGEWKQPPLTLLHCIARIL